MSLLIACLVIAGLHMNPAFYGLAVFVWLARNSFALVLSLMKTK